MLDKTIDKICYEKNPLLLKQKQFIELEKETVETVSKYKNYKEFKFESIDNSRKEIKELERKYEMCLRRRNRYLFGEIFKDKIIIALSVMLVALCILVFVTR